MAEMTAVERARTLADAEKRLDGDVGVDELRAICRLLVRVLREQAESDSSWFADRVSDA